MTATGRPASARWKAAGVGGDAVGACAVCCAGPILSVLGGLTAAFALGALWVPALAVVAIVAALALGRAFRRRRSAPESCTPGPAADLPMPTIPGARNERTAPKPR
ncbi:hypothetical protein SIM91_01590 [Rhodococcus opacus]|uniref:hypothetical protein n=1 Tax=Rhodococcus opacus TaxID=37919 RepID=UPI0029C3A77A|nr:hypothetical protein [Rhodococcus opacus]MDX5962040.1 hypothetical protein [Rhodococcus opacus]